MIQQSAKTRVLRGLPQKGHQSESRASHVVLMAGELAAKEAFFKEGAQHQKEDWDEGKNCAGVGAEP